MATVTAPERDYTPREQRRDAWLVATFGLACLAIVFAAISVGLGARAVDESKTNAAAAGTAGAAATAASVMVHLREFAIGDATVAAGGTLDVMNEGSVAHNITIRDTDLKTADLAGGGEEKLALSGLDEGTYTMFCSVPGHEAAGMKATLTVSGGGGTAAPASSHAMSAEEMDAAMKASIAAFPAKTDGVGAQLLEPTILKDGTKRFNLTAKVVQWEVSPGKKVEAWTYNGTVPGPTIKVNPGDKFEVVLKNDLPESTAIHFHGLTTPNNMDGVTDITQDPIKPGETFTYKWTAQATPAVGMYHSHHNAVKQVPNGMAAPILIGNLPVPDGVKVSQELTMMLDDAGTIGFALNGKSFPATAPIVAKEGEWVEIHYMNEGVMAHPMHLHGIPQLIIGKDGFPVPPQNADTIMVGPGERYTVLVKAEAKGIWAWHCHILTHAENDTGMFGMVTALIVK